MILDENFWEASLQEVKKGFTEETHCYSCLFCGKQIEKGVIYPFEDRLLEAERFMRVHIEQEHDSVFEYLVSQNKKVTGLSEHQSKLLHLFYQGKSDAEVQSELGIGSSSTVRNHRFVLKEKERQAKVFLVLMELLKEHAQQPALIPPHDTAKMVDDRYKITLDENDKVLKRYFTQGPNGPLKTFAMKEKNKLIVLRQIAKRFSPGRVYSEKEVNEILREVYEDFATLRRYLIEYGFMDRKSDCSQYWLKQRAIEDGGEEMDRKKELAMQYKEMKKDSGVYQIRNTRNNKVLVVATPDLKTMNGKRFQLQMGSHMNKQLQQDWNEYGEDAFEFEVLEVLKEKKEGYFDKQVELKKLEGKWLDELQPYGERGYNRKKLTDTAAKRV